MSIISSRRSISSIKGSDITPNRYTTQPSAKKVLRFHLPHNDRIKSILQKYVSGENLKEYEQLVCAIRDGECRDNEIQAILQETSQCVSILNRDLRLFVEAILGIKWADKNDEFVKEYQTFLVNLLTAHNYHVKYALDQLVSNFLPGLKEEEWNNGVPTDDDCKKFANVHSVINILLKLIPMSRELLLNSFVNLFPYFKKPTHTHEVYVHNMLWVLDYQPELRLDILNLIFSKLVVLDTNAPKEKIYEESNDEDVFTMDDCKSVISESRTKNSIAHTLDVCLDRIFNFIVVECHDLDTGQLNWDKTKVIYQVLINVFEKIILPTYNIHHVQFIMFFLCSFKSTITDGFITFLCKKVFSPNVASVIRQTSVAYVASLLARGAFISMSMLKSTLEHLSAWIHSYITTQDGLDSLNSDVRVHAVFYSVCQALFYVVAFRHRDLVSTRKNIAFLEGLNLGKIVTCRLNPLRVCQPAVVQNFAAVTRKYQLAYCYSIIEHNSRNIMPIIYLDEKGCTLTKSCILDSFFPFDPYILKRSGQKITNIYLEYKEANDENEEVEEEMEIDRDDDDFLNDPNSPRVNGDRFSYGTSPGFKH